MASSGPIRGALRGRHLLGYGGVIAACFVVGTFAGWVGSSVDNYAYDELFRRFEHSRGEPHSVVLGIDDATFRDNGGVGGLRSMTAMALEMLAGAQAKVIGVDVILADKSEDEARDARIEKALAALRAVVLPCDVDKASWEDPLPRFQEKATAIGHVHPDDLRQDGVNRTLPLEITRGKVRRWALALEVFRLWQQAPILESPDDLEIGGVTIPAPRSARRALLIRYLPQGIPVISLRALKENPALLRNMRGKAVFVGVTSQTAARDRVISPFGDLTGVEVHAHAFETMLGGQFLVPMSNLAQLGAGLLFAMLVGVVFAFRSGWQAWALAVLLLAAAHALPVLMFQNGVVSPYIAPVAAAWLTVMGAASYQYFVVRRQLLRSEADKSRYQEAIHFVAHEMRSPLTAIQGSSELMSRYNMGDDKRKQMAEMINSESKRLARMIQTFLDVERLSEGEMDLKREPFEMGTLIRTCMERARPLAERKQILFHYEEPVDATLEGDRELMEYAFYNLLTNAVKYSPPETNVFIEGRLAGAELRLSVRDEGIGMDAKELRQIFTKFYRTKKAEASGEAGTGIGLSIVDQIVRNHGGKMDVESEPGVGSCFTMILTRRTADEGKPARPSSTASRSS